MTSNYADRPKIQDDADVVRHVDRRSYDSSTNEYDPSAFYRTKKDQDGLSFMQRLVLANEDHADRKEIQRVFALRYKPHKKDVFAELNVHDALETLRDFGQELFFCADPIPASDEIEANDAHVLMIGLPFEGDKIGSLRFEVAGDRLGKVVKGNFPAI